VHGKQLEIGQTQKKILMDPAALSIMGSKKRPPEKTMDRGRAALILIKKA
jgi:hypothetical protein